MNYKNGRITATFDIQDHEFRIIKYEKYYTVQCRSKYSDTQLDILINGLFKLCNIDQPKWGIWHWIEKYKNKKGESFYSFEKEDAYLKRALFMSEIKAKEALLKYIAARDILYKEPVYQYEEISIN